MPLLTAPPPTPPAEVRLAPPTAAELQDRLLEAYDWGRSLPEAPKGPGAKAYRWLQAAATFDPQQELPADPFPPGAAHREAEALRALMKAPRARLAPRLVALPLHEPGTALALWRWGQIQVREGHFTPALRRAWEDRLLGKGPGLIRGYALRHALCWALAEQDETRFASLKVRADESANPVISQFQRLFGLLGGPSPILRLWNLPGQNYQDSRLDQLGARRLWILPASDATLPELPADVAWIIPSLDAGRDDRSASLPGGLLAEAQALSARLQAASRTAYYIPSRAAFEQLGMAWFPILVELDGLGNIKTVRMGDAAPQKP
ncbi:hypothetical protein [Geothrix fuzhouensis]|uniref:hypothetical protein n=1 Tax=Geothrix fuzhouensis TaxID=2966451 RepID=UPI002149052F|nr:hypothetical protein [Geothrix fuzhouensis]